MAPVTSQSCSYLFSYPHHHHHHHHPHHPSPPTLTSQSCSYPFSFLNLSDTSLLVWWIMSRPKAVTEPEISRQGILPTVAPVKPYTVGGCPGKGVAGGV